MSKKELIGTVRDKEPEKYVFDYGGPNIGKSMHVGHLRPLNIGRALYNIYSISNNECISDIHLGDWGIPIAQILTYCYENNLSIENISINDLKEIYPKASLASEENKEFKKLVNTNLIKLNSKHPEIIADWKIISDLTINNVKSVLSKLGHSFDLFYGESTVIDIIPKMIKDLENKQLVTRDSGALISSEDTNPPVLVLKSDGSYLYMTTDLATVLDREKNISPDNYYYIVDSRKRTLQTVVFVVKYFQSLNLNLNIWGLEQ